MEKTMQRTITTLALGALFTFGLADASHAAESGRAASRHVMHRTQTVPPRRYEVVPQGYYDVAPGYEGQRYYDQYDYQPSGADISGAIGGIGR